MTKSYSKALITLTSVIVISQTGAAKASSLPLLVPGTAAPDFNAIALNGKPIHLSDLRGKIVVLDFWASWCPWCDKLMPQVQDIYTRYGNKGVVVLGLAVKDTADAAFAYIQAHPQYTYSFAFDPSGNSSNSPYTSYHISGIPTTYIIDPAGKVLYNEEGYTDSNEQDIALAIDSEIALLNTPPTINDGEMLLAGTIIKPADSTGTIEISASSVTDQDGETTTFDKARNKSIVTNDQTVVTKSGVIARPPDLTVGTLVYVVGKGTGSGKPLTADTIAVPFGNE